MISFTPISNKPVAKLSTPSPVFHRERQRGWAPYQALRARKAMCRNCQTCVCSRAASSTSTPSSSASVDSVALRVRAADHCPCLEAKEGEKVRGEPLLLSPTSAVWAIFRRRHARLQAGKLPRATGEKWQHIHLTETPLYQEHKRLSSAGASPGLLLRMMKEHGC